jgi:methylamine dehydrogenase accessory protein MauD
VEALVISNMLLWLVILIMGVVIFALTRQIGVLYERVAPAGALMLNKQLRVGMTAPEMVVEDLDGHKHALGQPSKVLKSQLLFFVSPDCPVCKTLLPVVASAAKSEQDWLDIVLASDGDMNHRQFVEQHKLGKFPYIVSEILGVTYGVSKLPYAVLIDEHGKIASMGIINSREHLESLFEAKELKVASIQDYMNQAASNLEQDSKEQKEQLYTELR